MTYTPKLLEDIRRTADLCVKCNICTSVRARSSRPRTCSPGRNIAAAGAALPHPARPSPDHLLDYCSGCGVCTLVCPHGVKVMEINTAAKAEMRERQLRETPLDPKLWRNTLFGYNEALGQVGGIRRATGELRNELRPALIAEKTFGIDHRAAA